MMFNMILPQSEKKRQSLRMRRTLMALSGAVLHTLLCLLIWELGFFQTSAKEFVILFLGFWCINLLFPLSILLGWNLRLPDPSMTFLEVMWAVTCVLISMYFTHEMRPALMMFILLALAFGAFQLAQKAFLIITFYALLGYLLILFVLSKYRPPEVAYREELIAFSAFVIVCLVFSLVTHEMGAIRRHLQKKTLQLRDTLSGVETASVTDELTGIKNRRFIFGVLEQQRWIAERNANYSFALIMLDIDNFKKINDKFGHVIGDQILKKICDIIDNDLRKMDFFARIGGEEFLIVIPLGNLASAAIIAERVRLSIERADFSKIIKDITLTLSLGVTIYQGFEKIEDTLKRADKALYKAKTLGRNKVVIV